MFGTGLAYSYPEARFTKGYLAVISRAPFPHSILYDRQELVVLKSKLDATGSTFLEYVYASAPTTVTGTNAEGFSFDLDLAQGWNQVVALYRFSTQKIEYRSTIPPADLVYRGFLQSGQILLAGEPSKDIDDRTYSFSGQRIVLEYGTGTNTTYLYTPANQGKFIYVTPLKVSDEQLSDASTVFEGSVQIISGPLDAKFARLFLRVYNDTGEGPTIAVAELYRGKKANSTYTILDYFYSSKGGVTLSSSDQNLTLDNLSLSQGWNTITYSNPDASTFEGMEWRVRVQTQ